MKATWCFSLSFLSVFAGQQGLPAVLWSSLCLCWFCAPDPKSDNAQWANVALLVSALNSYVASAGTTRRDRSAWVSTGTASTSESLAWGWVQSRGAVWGTLSSGFPPSPSLGSTFSVSCDINTKKASPWPYRAMWSLKTRCQWISGDCNISSVLGPFLFTPLQRQVLESPHLHRLGYLAV